MNTSMNSHMSEPWYETALEQTCSSMFEVLYSFGSVRIDTEYGDQTSQYLGITHCAKRPWSATAKRQ